MKNVRVRLICMVMVIAMLIGCVLVSCGEEKVEPPKDTKTTDTEPLDTEEALSYEDDVPEFDFGGEAVNILTPSGHYIVFDEPSDDRVNFAKYRATLAMEERFKCDMVEIAGDENLVNTASRNIIRSGSDDYDFITPFGTVAHFFAEEGLLYSFDELPYIDLTKGYWDQSLLPHTTVGDKVYSAYGMCNFEYYRCTHCLVFSKDMIAINGLESPYGLVRSNAWTLDKMYEMMSVVKADKNGDGVMDANDVYGFLCTPKEVLPAFWTAGGTMIVSRDEDNLPVMNVAGNTRLFDIIDKCFKIFKDDELLYPVDSWSHHETINDTIFKNGNALFADYQFYSLEYLRECEVDFGILPYPKFDLDQQNYISRVESGDMVVVPITNKNPEELSAFLEAMGSTGYKEVYNDYVESTLKRRDSRDEESADMVTLIINTRTFDLGDIWYCAEMRDSLFIPMWNQNNNGIAASYKKYEKMFDRVLEQTREAYTK